MYLNKEKTVAIVMKILKNKLLICSFTGSLLLCVISLIILPPAVEFTKTHLTVQKIVIFLIIFLSAIFTVIFISAMGYLSERQIRNFVQKNFREYIKNICKFILFCSGFFIVYFIACGILSSAVYLVFKSILSYEKIKLIIDIFTTIMTLTAIPCAFTQMLAFSLNRLPFRKCIREGILLMHSGYAKLFFITAFFFAAGFLCTAVFSLADQSIFKTTGQTVIFTLIGGISTYKIYMTGIGIYSNR